MAKKKRSSSLRNRDIGAPEAPSSRINAAESESIRALERSKRSTSPINLILRIVLFVLACVYAVLGVKGFIDATNIQNTSRTVTTESIQAEPGFHALALFSYDESDSSVAYERDGVLSVLARSGISYDPIYLDARSITGNAEAEQRLDGFILEKAMSEGGYDAVIAAGDEALSYVYKHQELFAGIPTSFFAVDDKSLATDVHSAGVATGIYEDGTATTSLEQAAKLVPSARNVVILADGSMESNGLLAQVTADTSVAPSVKRDIWDVSTFTRDELANRLSSLGSDTFVLLLAANHDSSGTSYTPSTTAYFVSGNTSVPVFSALGGVGEGICASSFVDRADEGLNAVRLAVSLINGNTVGSQPIQSVSPECCVFDAQALTSHGIDPNATPDNAAIINESAFSLRVLRPIATPLLFILISIACIVAFGVIGFRRSMRSNREIIASRNQLRYRLYHDLLTDLPNRYALDQYVSSEETEGKIKSMIQIDINDFTDINDSYGHTFGDSVIKIVAQRLTNIDSLLLVRSGGDEFILAFDRPLQASSPQLRHIERIFNDPVVVGDSKVDLTSTIGVANREQGMTAPEMIINSDLAMHSAKEINSHFPVFYSEGMLESVEKKVEITAYLKQAVADEAINVLWQPQVDTKTLEIYGYEALCRLEGNRYYPGEFIPVSEMSGLVVPLGRIVTKKVIAQMGEWLKEGRDVGIASINYSAAQLRDKDYCNFLADQLAIYGVPASKIKIEITESMILGNEDDAELLFKRLRSMGVTLALDDFGTGYSSLYRMASRPMDIVKLDKSLVDTFMVDGKEGFISDITTLIHGLGKTIVVEGVETYEQYQMCLEMGCDIIQGYFFSRPVSAQEAVDFDANIRINEARIDAGDKTRNGDWRKYDRDAHGRWKKKEKTSA